MKQNIVMKYDKLPKGWIKTNLDSIGIINSGSAAPQGEKFFKNGKYPFVRVADMGKLNTVFLNDTRDHINDLGSKKLSLFPKGSVLFTKSGASTHLNQRAILGIDSYVVSHIGIIYPLMHIPSEWIYYFLKIIDFKSLTHSTTLPSMKLSTVKNLTISVPPLNEQKRIIKIVEKSLSQIDSAKKSIEFVKLQLKQFEQSLLKSIFLKCERKPLSEVCNLIAGQHVLKENYNTEKKGLGYITGPIDFSEKSPIISKWTTYPKTIAIENDVLITVKGAGIGKVNILDQDEVCISRQLMAIRTKNLNPLFVYYFLKSEFLTLQEMGIGSTIPGIDKTKILKISLAVADIEKQNEIVSKLEKGFVLIQNTETVIKLLSSQLKTLQTSILKQAFEGKLVPQNPNDEPASVLLERINKEKTQ